MKMSLGHFKKLQAGRKEYQALRSVIVLNKANKLLEEGVSEVKKISKKDLFIAGVALYWAEGFKHRDESGLGLATSDPEMARFYVNWLKHFLNISVEDLKFRVTANISHKERIMAIEEFWFTYLKISHNQFTKPFSQNSQWKKRYLNRNQYYGVIRIHVRKSLDRLRKMRGWIKGLKQGFDVK
jgi:hypothetical protein